MFSLKVVGLVVFLSAISHVQGYLSISLNERSDTPLLYNTLIEITNNTKNQSNVLKRIDLVLGRAYNLYCEESESHGSPLTAVWFAGDTEVPPGSVSDPDRPSVFSFLEGSKRTLVLSNFTGGNVGIYKCRERGSSNTDGSGIVLGANNPTVITIGQNKVLTHGQQGNSRPSLIAFLSGIPYPTGSDIIWRLNNKSLPSDFIVNGNELLLPVNIRSELEGRYTCHVTTSAGSSSDNIYVSLIYTPSVSVTPSGPQAVRINSSITFICEDSEGIPSPTFSWSHNGSSLREIGRISRTDETTASSYRSSLTISNFQSIDVGEYMCTASNEAGVSYQTVSVSILQTSPPSPPAHILVSFVSACSIQIEWVWPQTTSNDDVAPPDYIVFEMNIIDEPHWLEVGRADVTQTSLVVRVPVSGRDTRFQLRAKGVSNSHGEGEYYTSTEVLTAYSSGLLSALISSSAQVISSTSIQLSWNLQFQGCFNATAVTISCRPAQIDLENNGTFTRSTDVDDILSTVGIVSDLELNTSYNCSVSANLTERVNGDFFLQVEAYVPTLTTTYPKVGIFELYLKGIPNCREWTVQSTAAKKNDISTAIAVAIERICNCAFIKDNIQRETFLCSSASPSIIIYQMEVYDSEQASLPQLLSYLREWVSTAPSLVVQSQLVDVGGGCFLTEEDCITVVEETHTERPISTTYVVIGAGVGVALLLIVSIAVIVLIIAVLITRHRKTKKLNSSNKKVENGISGVTNPIPQVNLDSAVPDPYYEEVDIQALGGEPQYESLDDYDKLSPKSESKIIMQEKLADCPAYEPTTFSHTS